MTVSTLMSGSMNQPAAGHTRAPAGSEALYLGVEQQAPAA